MGLEFCHGLRVVERPAKQGGPPGISKESEVPDANEASRQNVLGKPAQKFRRGNGHFAMLVAVRVFFREFPASVAAGTLAVIASAWLVYRRATALRKD